jgi:beta-lactamase class D
MLVEKTPDDSIWAKTGWPMRVTPKVGWYLGDVEILTERWFFSTNIVAEPQSDLPLRQLLTREALKVVGVLAER